jgi:hypothetical protein
MCAVFSFVLQILTILKVRDFYITAGNLKRPLKFHLYWIDKGVPRADETGRSRYTLLGPEGPEGGPGPDYIAFIFVFIDGIC